MSRLIKWFTRSPYSHVGVMVEGTLYEALAGGVRALAGRDAVNRMREAVAYRALPASHTDERQTAAFLRARVAKPAGPVQRLLRRAKLDPLVSGYSVLGLMSAGIGDRFPRAAVIVALPQEYVCSAVVADAIQCAGYIPDVEPRCVSPGSLAALIGAEVAPWASLNA